MFGEGTEELWVVLKKLNTVLVESRDLIFQQLKKVLLDYSAYNDNIDGRQENEITIPILYDNNNDIVTTSTINTQNLHWMMILLKSLIHG